MEKFKFLLVVTIFFGNVAIGQNSSATRSQTESWLLEKLNKYVAKNSVDCNKILPGHSESPTSDCTTYTNVSFKFSGDNLVVNTAVNFVQYKDRGAVETNFNRTITIPLYDLSRATYFSNYDIVFIAKYQAIKFEDSNGKSSASQMFKIGFLLQQEENLEDRITKAFNHLRTFVKKPKTDEVF